MIGNYIFHNKIENENCVLGIALAENIAIDTSVDILEQKLAQLLQKRQEPLGEQEDATRKKVREMLRNGKYRPSGRSKPASEYLLRAAAKGEFPRINAAVDTINYLSLQYLVPISLWDIDLANSKEYSFRLGREEESYVFNQGGQVINIRDLIAGFAVIDSEEKPIVTPVKDSLATKTTEQSKNVAMVVYYPGENGGENRLQAILQDFAEVIGHIAPQPVIYKIY